MFRMTSRAHAVARRVTAHPRVSSTSGLRIAEQGSEQEPLGVGIVPAAQAGDQVVEHDGARIFLDDRARSRVRGQLLDAVTERTGRIHFIVRPPR